MSGPKTRVRLPSRIALLGAALALVTGGCTEEGIDLTALEVRQAQLGESFIYQFLRPPETPSDDCTVTLEAGTGGAGDAALIQDAIDAAMPFDIICLARGVYTMSSGLTIDAPASLTLRGIGSDPDDVELDFDSQSGSDGLTVTAPGFWLENVWVHDAASFGVNLSSSSSDQDPSVLRKVKISWADDASLATNGFVGVLIGRGAFIIVEFSEVIGATVAGLFVDTSSDVILRNNFTHDNSIGISFVNSTDMELVSNDARDNTTGILALQAPTAELTRNENVLLVKNDVRRNNLPRFATPIFFGVAAATPVGTGVMIVAGTNLELRENWISDNTSTGILMLSNFTADALASLNTTPSFPPDYDAFPGYDPFPTNIYVNDNALEFPDDNDFFQDESYNGLPVDQDFIDDWNAVDAISGSPNYNPIPPCMSDDPATVGNPPPAPQPPPNCLVNEANDPNTLLIPELINRPIILDGESADFGEGVRVDPAMCLGLEDDRPLVYISLDTPRRGYPFPDGSAPRQDPFECELPELPTISFP